MKKNYAEKRPSLFNSFLILSFFLISNVAFGHWNSKGPYGGTVNCFAVIDTNVYAASPTGGVFRSTNKTLSTWKAVNNGLTSNKIHALSSIGTTVIAGSAEEGIFISRDLGANWIQRNNGLTDKKIQALASSGNKIFAGTSNGLFLSSDTGKTWTAISNGLTSTSVTALVINNTNLYAGTANGVFISTNYGGTWTAIKNGLGNTNITSLAISGLTIFAGTKSGLYSANTASATPSFNWVNADNALNAKTINGLTVAEGALYIATNTGIYTNPGSTVWNSGNSAFTTDSVNAIAFYNSKFLAGTQSQGIFSSPVSPISWVAANNGFNNVQTYALFASGSMIITATNMGVYVSKNLATSYILSNKGLTDSLHVTQLAFTGTRLFAGTINGGVFLSADTGKSWTPVNTNLTNMSVKAMLTSSTQIFIGTADGSVFSSPLNTVSWTSVNTGLPTGLKITSFSGDGQNLYMGSLGNGVYVNHNLSSWSAINSGLTNKNVTALATLDNNLFAATSGGGIFITSFPSSDSWTAVNNGLSDLNITSLGVTGKYVLAGYKGGVNASLTNGNKWLIPSTLLNIPTYADITAIAFTDTRIFVNTPDNSVYSNAKSELPTGIFDSYTIESNQFNISPNPNKGTFRIDLNRPDRNILGISLFDISGRLLEIIDGPNPDQISVNYPSGIYFVQLKTTLGVLTKKMIIE